MRILLTGGAGFIGAKIAARYRALGHSVLVFDKHPVLPYQESFVGDVTQHSDVRHAMAEFEPDVVSHHAANVDIQGSIVQPSHDALANIQGTAIVSECARAYRVKRLIYASSSSCYGQQSNQPVFEWASPMPLNPYGYSKWAAEYYARLHEHAVVFRYGNVYGPGQSIMDRGVVGIFARQLLMHEPPTLFGNATHDFIYVQDVVEANVLALNCVPMTMNIGSGVGTSINEILTLVEMTLNKRAKARLLPKQPGTYDKMVLDISLARACLQWEPSTSLQDGIAATCAWVNR